MIATNRISRRVFLTRTSTALLAAPLVASSRVFGANDRIVMGCIGVGGQGRGDMGGYLGFKEVQVRAVCDVVGRHRELAKGMVDGRYGNQDCQTYTHFEDVLARRDIDAVLIATPDHWHAVIAIEAMKQGKDVYCEKPECLTIRQGRAMVQTARRYGRVLSGGSQRVWGDYNWFHKMVRGGRIGQPKEAWVNVGGPSEPCYLEPVATPADDRRNPRRRLKPCVAHTIRCGNAPCGLTSRRSPGKARPTPRPARSSRPRLPASGSRSKPCRRLWTPSSSTSIKA